VFHAETVAAQRFAMFHEAKSVGAMHRKRGCYAPQAWVLCTASVGAMHRKRGCYAPQAWVLCTASVGAKVHFCVKILYTLAH